MKKTELGEQDRNKGTEERQTGKGQVEESPQKERNQEGFAKKRGKLVFVADENVEM